jgi:glycosyltransferase involved in cell wall biosynthesis
VPVAAGTRFARDPLLRRADVVTTLSEGMSAEYAAAGVPADRLVVLDNFTSSPAELGDGGDAWLFAGRIEVEKGLHDLIPQWPRGVPLLVAGAPDTPVPLPTHPDVTLLGRVSPDELRGLMGSARGLVFPSLWLEGLALVCLEALSVGTPILTFDDIPAGASVARLGVGSAAGRSDVPGAVAAASATFPGLRAHCREVFEREFTPQAWLPKVEAVYARAMGH